MIAAAAMGLILLGCSPFSFETGSVEATIGSVLGAAAGLRPRRDLLRQAAAPARHVGFFVFPLALYGACAARQAGLALGAPPLRRAQPGKQAKAEERFPPDRRTERFKNAFRDIVGGKPSEGVAAATEEALAATREAAEEVRQRAERGEAPGRRSRRAARTKSRGA